MSHVSFSALKNWDRCAFYHKLTYIDKLRLFKGNEYTAFGTALHSVCEGLLLDRLTEDEAPSSFKEYFREELDLLPEDLDKRKALIVEMFDQGRSLSTQVMSAVEDYFGEEYEIVSTEEQILEPIRDFTDEQYDFKGFIDAVFKTPDGKYHIVDWKTCSWGWDARRKSDRMTTYQLTFYKYYFAIKHGIDPKNIETHFALLKRTAKKNNVEFFRVTSGNKKTQNAIKFLTTALYNITRKKYTKNRLACSSCEFHRTKHCP
tara:strand:- start:3565 stop:4344 length:780 start_codon:yes stop_codon:yes gene_type:complete